MIMMVFNLFFVIMNFAFWWATDNPISMFGCGFNAAFFAACLIEEALA
jgi:hypothetical protein